MCVSMNMIHIPFVDLVVFDVVRGPACVHLLLGLASHVVAYLMALG